MSDAITQQIAARVLGIFTGPETWTQKTEARDEKGNPVDIQNPRACSFCLRGSVNRACYDLGLNYDQTIPFRDALYGLAKGGVCYWNDNYNRRFEEVVDLVKQIAA